MTMAYPEAVCLRKQMAKALKGKEIADVSVEDVAKSGGSWRLGSIVQAPKVFQRRLHRGVVLGAESVANSVFLTTSTGCSLVLGYTTGNVAYHEPGEDLPTRRCLSVRFADDSHLTVTISMWGLIRALREGERPAYVAKWYGRGIEPNSKRFTLKGFRDAAAAIDDPKLSVKKFLHAFEPGHYVSGIDAALAQEILYDAGVHPKRTLASLTPDELKACHRSVNKVTKAIIRQGGRSTEFDLYGRPGGYVPHVCRATLGQPCPTCGTAIEMLKFEGGSCYVCPHCQEL